MKLGNHFLQDTLKLPIFQARTQQQPTIQQSLTRRRTRAPQAVVYELDDSD